jgi:futalosine hydrolase
MQILIAAATEEEIEGIRSVAEKKLIDPLKIDFLVTGVGMTATAYSLMKKISSRKYSLAINIGVAGSFRKEIEIGETVAIISDTFADLGAEDGEQFLSVFEMGLQQEDRFPFYNGKLKADAIEKYSTLHSLKKVKAISVNRVHGNDESIRKTVKKFHPDIESMEGAAFFYVCMHEKIPCIQLRGISNHVERRNREGWNIPLALTNLNRTAIDLLNELKR